MNIWHDISADRIKKDDFIAVVEIEKGGTNKYELDKATGLLRLDRVYIQRHTTQQIMVLYLEHMLEMETH